MTKRDGATEQRRRPSAICAITHTHAHAHTHTDAQANVWAHCAVVQAAAGRRAVQASAGQCRPGRANKGRHAPTGRPGPWRATPARG
jgi:hypothetical protein